MDIAPGGGPIRLGVADDHPAIGLAIEAAAAASPSVGRPVRLVGHARTVAAALEMIAHDGADGPDVLLCDLEIERGTDGLAVIVAATRAGVLAIAFTSHDRASLMRAVFEAGGAGFLSKGLDVAEVLAAVRTVAAGGSAFSARALEAARNAPRPPSDRERAVMAGVAVGRTSDEIGHVLAISGRTVESHLRRLFDRYGVVSRAELVVLAASEGWIETGAG